MLFCLIIIYLSSDIYSSNILFKPLDASMLQHLQIFLNRMLEEYAYGKSTLPESAHCVILLIPIVWLVLSLVSGIVVTFLPCSSICSTSLMYFAFLCKCHHSKNCENLSGLCEVIRWSCIPYCSSFFQITILLILSNSFFLVQQVGFEQQLSYFVAT